MKWNKRKNSAGWTRLTRGNCRITVSPSGRVMLYSPGITTEHVSLDAAKAEARKRPQKGWR